MAATEKKNKAKKDPVKEYGRVVDAAELEAVNLIHMEFDVRPRYFTERDETQLSYTIDVDSQKYDEESGNAVAFISCAVGAHVEDEALLSFEGQYVVAYKVSEKCDHTAVETFLKRVAVFACYPYFRSVVANLDWAAGTGIPPMPVHKEPKVQAKKEVEAVTEA